MTPEEKKAREQREFAALATLGGFVTLAVLAGLAQFGMQYAEYRRRATRPKQPWELMG